MRVVTSLMEMLPSPSVSAAVDFNSIPSQQIVDKCCDVGDCRLPVTVHVARDLGLRRCEAVMAGSSTILMAMKLEISPSHEVNRNRAVVMS